MRSLAARIEFEKFLAKRFGRPLPRTPAEGLPAMLEFFRDVRVEDVNAKADGDMLLFQWGTYDWGAGAKFELDLARQLIRGSGGDGGIRQLHLAFRFATSAQLTGLGKGNKRCSSTGDLGSFESFVLEHPTVRALGQRADGVVEVRYDRAG